MTGDYRPPCQVSKSPDDWFIGRDGKQYPDDEFLGVEKRAQVAEKAAGAMPANTPFQEREEVIANAIFDAEDAVRRAAITRRRHARDACHVECYRRLECLSQGLEIPHGTWGGYYEEERREIVKLREEKRLAREADHG